MADVAVVVPWQGGCIHREAAWEWVRDRYATTHPGWEIVEALASSGEWCKGAALQATIQGCEAEIVIQADADVWTDGLDEAVGAVESGVPWAIPHLLLHRLSEEGTAAVLAGADWQDQVLVQRPYRGVAGGGVVVAPRDVLCAVPVDARFSGWGQDDEAHSVALNALVGQPWRGKAPLLHLWHPPQERLTRRRGSRRSWELRQRYIACKNDPAALAALLEEGRVDRSASQHARHDHPALTG